MKKLKCRDVQLRNRITSFVQSKGWDYRDFPSILASAGIHHPVDLQVGEGYDLLVRTGEGIDYDIDLILDQHLLTVRMANSGNESIEKLFALAEKEKTNGETKVILEQISFEIGNSTLNCIFNYGDEKDQTIWGLNILWPNKKEVLSSYEIRVKNKNFAKENLDEATRIINSYLLNLEDNSDFDEVYGDLMNLMLEAKIFDVSEYYDVIHLVPSLLDDFDIGDRITVTKGRFSEYARTKEGVTVDIKDNGDWIYRTEQGVGCFKVEYQKMFETYEYTASGTLPEINKLEVQKEAILKGRCAAEELFKILETTLTL